MEKEEREMPPMFNGHLDTLERLNKLLQDTSQYFVEEHVIAIKRNLRELYKESKGFLDPKEQKTAKNKWDEVVKYPIKIDNFSVTFDEKLMLALDEFDTWIRYKLHKKHVTVAKNKQALEGMTRVMARYGLNETQK